MRPTAFIDCNDYNVGKFNPISFTPSLKWKITKSEYIEHPKKLPKLIVIEAKLYNFIIKVNSNPYSWGRFNCECRGLGLFYHFGFLNHTNDPEEAVYLTELCMLKWAQEWLIFSEAMVMKFNTKQTHRRKK